MSRKIPKSELGLRGGVTDEKARDVLSRIETLVSVDDVERLAETAIVEIRERIRGHQPCVAWSGGKDSLVAEHLMARAGIHEHRILGLTAELEYPAMDAWYYQHAPLHTTILRADRLTWAFLAKHQDWIFPRTSAAKHRWWTWQGAQQEYAETYGCDMIVLGRRIQDQNFCGRDGLYLSRGVWRYSPIRDWTHEEVWAYIHYHGLPVPPVYGWHNGFAEGTHPWPDRSHTVDDADGWAQIHSIDPSIVARAAAEGIVSAQDWLANPTPIKTHGKPSKPIRPAKPAQS